MNDLPAAPPPWEHTRSHLCQSEPEFYELEPGGALALPLGAEGEIVVRSAKSEAVTVTVREPVPGDWTMVEESKPHAKVAAGTAEGKVDVPAGGATTLRYRVLVRY